MLVCCRLQPFWTGNSLDRVKEAGFHGVCFDIEMTKGEKELAEAFEKAFAACRSAGLLVLVTTSHSAPYAASSDNAKELLVDSWVASKNIDIFSPQLYTSGTEAAPEFDEAPCHVGHTGWRQGNQPKHPSKCSWERLKPMRAKWIPSISVADHYPEVKQFFAEKGIKTEGFIQWR